MGRKKSYDRDSLIGEAVELFRDHGFAGTSAEMLSQRLGVNRFSIYAEFGSKQGLFEAALERYDQENVERNFGPLESPDSGVAEIKKLFEFFGAAAEGNASGRGCLLCNTAVEFGPEDPGGSGYVQDYFERIGNAFNSALKNAQSRSELKESVDTSKEAEFLTATVLGLFVMLRAKAPHTTIRSAVQVAKQHVEALCVKPSMRA
jgi:TetR/AcrR family transcriptional repressor of nem operon